MIQDPIWFHVNREFLPETNLPGSIIQEVQEFFKRTIGNGLWLSPVPNTTHFVAKFPRKIPEGTRFSVIGTNVRLPGIAIIYLECQDTRDVIALRIELETYMAVHRFGCYALPEVASQSAKLA